MSLASFLDKYDTIIFDMDGVITSEENYWDIAALTVFEMLRDSAYFGTGHLDVAGCLESIPMIRQTIFLNDRLIKLIKERGVNSNWDLAFIVMCANASGKVSGAEELYDYLVAHPDLYAFDLYKKCAEIMSERFSLPYSDCERGAKLWVTCQKTFQEWYLGSALFPDFYPCAPNRADKPPLYEKERPLIPLDELMTLLSALNSAGKRLCVGTGRPAFEIAQPMRMWDMAKYFDQNGCINYNDITDAEEALFKKGKSVTLTKPHPWMFLKALYGRDYDDERLLSGDYDKSKISRTLVVGDAGADILAAKAMGADFAAVLTGIAGEGAREYFTAQNAEYILHSILDFKGASL